ncbi:MAG: hypothetical protein ACRDCB_14385 [Clostridium sp.]
MLKNLKFISETETVAEGIYFINLEDFKENFRGKDLLVKEYKWENNNCYPLTYEEMTYNEMEHLLDDVVEGDNYNYISVLVNRIKDTITLNKSCTRLGEILQSEWEVVGLQ